MRGRRPHSAMWIWVKRKVGATSRNALEGTQLVCFAICNDTLYVTIDAKPKRSLSTLLKRLKNIAENPAVAVVVDRYEEDWGQLGWVMLRGHAEILMDGREHDGAGASALSVSATQEDADRGASGDRRAHCKCHELG